MQRLIDPIDIHSAADTWSGFLYQGKVALLHILKLLNTDNNANDYHLQLDSLEDFAIVNEDLTPRTLHQVKAMKSIRYASYRVAFEKLEKRFQEYPCQRAYFHLANQNEMSKDDIHSAHPDMEIYAYQWGRDFCFLEEINSKLEEQIEIFLSNNGLGHYQNPGNLNKLRNKLESIICDQIIGIHANNHRRDGMTIAEGAYYFTIPLSSFDAILRTDPLDGLDSNYFLFLTKELLNHYYTEYCIELEDNGEINLEDKKKLDIYMQQINALDDNSLMSFLRNILPHRTVKLDSIRGFKDGNIGNEEFKDAFLQSLFELVACPGKIGENFLWRDIEDICYTVTAIKDGQRNLNNVCARIYKNINEADIEVPYETDKLITLELEVDSLKEGLRLHTISGEREALSGTGKGNNILRWSDISLVKLDDAKNLLK